MNNWSYNELIETINESFKEQLLQGLSTIDAIGITSENFMFYPLEDNKVENLVTLIETIFLCLDNLNFVYETTIEKYQKQKALLTKKEIKEDLLEEEFNLLMIRIRKLEFLLVNSEIKPVV